MLLYFGVYHLLFLTFLSPRRVFSDLQGLWSFPSPVWFSFAPQNRISAPPPRIPLYICPSLFFPCLWVILAPLPPTTIHRKISVLDPSFSSCCFLIPQICTPQHPILEPCIPSQVNDSPPPLAPPNCQTELLPPQRRSFNESTYVLPSRPTRPLFYPKRSNPFRLSTFSLLQLLGPLELFPPFDPFKVLPPKKKFPYKPPNPHVPPKNLFPPPPPRLNPQKNHAPPVRRPPTNHPTFHRRVPRQSQHPSFFLRQTNPWVCTPRIPAPP